MAQCRCRVTSTARASRLGPNDVLAKSLGPAAEIGSTRCGRSAPQTVGVLYSCIHGRCTVQFDHGPKDID